MSEELRPARGYSRAPFKEGHEVKVTHGAYLKRRVDPVARELVETIIEDVPYLSEPSYEPAVWAWARAEARVQVLAAWLDENGALDENGTPRPALAALLQFEKLASTHRTRLGLDPLSRAQLGRDVTAQQMDLARLYSTLDEKA
jgi:hypothetical protein